LKKNQDGGSRQLEFRKIDAIPKPFDQSSQNLMGM
jgi:hypothetical protein